MLKENDDVTHIPVIELLQKIKTNAHTRTQPSEGIYNTITLLNRKCAT